MSGHRASFLPSPYEIQKLRRFGEWIQALTGETPYLVGSALRKRTYRDVDVRIMLDSESFERWFGDCRDWRANGVLRLADMALSALGRDMTGLPIDCKIEHRDSANEQYGGETREPLFDMLCLSEKHQREQAAVRSGEEET